MKRQRGRNRGGNANGGGGNGGKPQHNVNRAFDSNGPDGVKIRGNAQHVFEKYQQLARDASSGGDRVLAEGYLQHAEHYFRVLRAVQPQRPPSDFLGRETFTSGYDIDFEDESNNHFSEEPVSEGENQATEGDGQTQDARGEQPYRNEQNRDQNRSDQNQNRGDRDWQNRSDQNRDQNRDRNFNRDQQQRDQQQQRPRDDRPRDDQRPREDRPREDRQRDRYPPQVGRYNDRNQSDRPRDEQTRDPLAVVEPEATPLTTNEPQLREPQLRSQDGALSPAPAFLQPRAERVETEAAETRRPRRTRTPRAVDGGQSPAETEEV
jgi:hypothetical protein